jgi:hypothetical protein
MRLSVKARTLAWFLLVSVGVYIVIIVTFAACYYTTASIGHFRPGTQFMEQIDFLRALYFSVVSFHTIGYGDIYPISQQGRTILMTQSFISLFYTSIFSGLLVYFIIKRHADIFTTRHIYIRIRKERWYLSIRLGNKGRPVIGLKGKFEAYVVRDNSRIRVFTQEQDLADLEYILYYDIDLDSPGTQKLRSSLQQTLKNGPRLHMKLNLIGNDITSGEQVALSVFYDTRSIRFGRMFLNVYSWDAQGRRHDFRWGHFEKVEPLEEEVVRGFLA